MIRHSAKQQPHVGGSRWLWLGPLLYMTIISMYFIGRFGGRWAEADSAVFTNLIRVVIQEGRLIPANGEVYPNGYAYQAITAYIVALTGLDLGTLQQLVYPLVAPLVILPAWVLYRELTGSARGATLTTMLLFTQPEFLFVILRSSHEKFTRTFMLLCLFWLVRSLKLYDRPWSFALHVGLFYLTAYAFIAGNNLLAHSFIFAIAIALILGRVLERRNPHLRQQNARVLQRLPYAILICIGLVYIFTFYIYPPAQHDLVVLQSIWDRSAALVLDVDHQRTNAYAAVAAGWIGLPVYFLLSIANWIILAASLAIWAWQGLQWLWRGAKPRMPMAWLVWLFYAAFAAQGALSVVADASGSLTSNLQHRIFPSFAIIAVAVVGSALAQWRPRRFTALGRAGLSAGIACIAILSVLKATNEPVLSNKWTFYRADELLAVEWSDMHLQDRDIWTEFDERLSVAFSTVHGISANQNRLVGDRLRATTHDLIVTEVTRLRSSRMGRPLPLPPDAFRVYDDGTAQVYHLRPQTPYQR
jgi:hypothetical protein